MIHNIGIDILPIEAEGIETQLQKIPMAFAGFFFGEKTIETLFKSPPFAREVAPRCFISSFQFFRNSNDWMHWMHERPGGKQEKRWARISNLGCSQ
jgi:hypothetical protein